MMAFLNLTSLICFIFSKCTKNGHYSRRLGSFQPLQGGFIEVIFFPSHGDSQNISEKYLLYVSCTQNIPEDTGHRGIQESDDLEP